jgi:uncharacterized protein (TIGR01777 family)
VAWDPPSRTVDRTGLVGIDAVVNLAGAGLGDHRWTEAYKGRIVRSRVDSTATIATAMAALEPRPRVLVSQAAIGFYGDTGGHAVDEGSPRGAGFAADVVVAWERAADPARQAGIRVAHTRTGLVMAPSGGAWQRLLTLYRLGLGGPMGGGRQWWSYVTLADWLGAVSFLLENELSGPVNVTAPDAVTQGEMASAMGQALHRPAVVPAPALALRVVLGEFASEVLSSTRVVPAALGLAGYHWRHATLEQAVATLA